MRRMYLDHIAGTPVHPEVVKAMLPYFNEKFGNPQSLHGFSDAAKNAVEEAREKVANLINADQEEIYFTSSGTESNNFAIKGLALANRKKGTHIVLSAIEHQSVSYAAKSLEKMGFTVTIVEVDKFGSVDPEDVLKAITDETVLVSIMYANSEVGTIQPVDEIARVVKERGVIFHTDAVGAAGILPIDVGESNVDALSLAGNQFYAPQGTGALYVKKGIRVIPLMEGGIQEDGRRPGTENVPGIVGLGKAAELANERIAERANHVKVLRDRLIEGLLDNIDRVYLTGHPERRLPNHASFCVEFIEGEAMLLRLDMAGIAVSSGSACTSRALKTSHVLTAMKIPAALAQGSIVFSFGRDNSEEDVEYVVESFPQIVETLRKMSPLYTKYLNEKENG
jgi:cysteine desulfurase